MRSRETNGPNSRGMDKKASTTTSSAGGQAGKRVFGTVLLLLLTIYASTAQWSQPYHIDAMTNAITGWYIGNEGTVLADRHRVLAEPQNQGNLGWFVDSPAGTVSQYPPGAAIWAGLFYALTPGDLQETVVGGTNHPDLPPVEVPLPPIWPATLSAVIATALAGAILAVTCYRISGERRSAITAGIVFGVATTAWSVASTMSWTHGVAMMSIALGLLFLESNRWLTSGLAFAFAILTRPHLAVIPAMAGLGISLARRETKPALWLGASSSVGLVGLLAYNYAIWERLTISGGYGASFTDQFLDSSAMWFLRNVLEGVFDSRHGLLTWAPFLVVLVVGAVASRHNQSPWALWTAVGGVAYLLMQWRANRFSGGAGHFAYRYPLETLVAAWPSLYLGYVKWVRGRRLVERLLWLGLALPLVGQAFYLSQARFT